MSLVDDIAGAWSDVAAYVADGHEAEFVGQCKEDLVLKHIRAELERRCPETRVVGPADKERFGRGHIDLVCVNEDARVGVEADRKSVV